MSLLSFLRPKPVIIHEVRYVVATKRENAAYEAAKKAKTKQLEAELAAAQLRAEMKARGQ